MTSEPVLRPLVLGVVTGLRSQLGLAALAWSAPASARDTRALRLLRSVPGRGLTSAGATAELVADKLPSTPSRLEPQGIAFRLLAGAGVGALAANSTDRRTVGVASALGLAGAAAGTYAGAYYRKLLPARTHTPDLPWALGEDAVAAALAATAIKVWPEPRPWWQRALRALARTPRAVAGVPKTIAGAPKAAARAPKAVAGGPKALARAPGRRPRAQGPRPRAQGRRPRPQGSRRRAEGGRARHPEGGAGGCTGAASRRRYGDVPAAVIGTAAEPG